MEKCNKCGKILKNKAGLSYHIKVKHDGFRQWNKGLTKNKNKGIEKYSKNHKKVVLSDEKEIERRNKISKTAKLRGTIGGYRIGSGRSKGSWYKNEYMDSSYELEYAKWLDKNKIKWIKNKIKFPYIFEGKERYYIPDFYLPDTDEYIEIKGFKTDKDDAKWKYFPYSLKVLYRHDLNELCNLSL